MLCLVVAAGVDAQEPPSGEERPAAGGSPEAAGSPDEGAPVEDAPPSTDAAADGDAMLEEELRALDAEMFAEDEPSETPDTPSTPSTRPANDPVPELREVTVRYTPQDLFRMGGSVQAIEEEQLEKLQYDDPNAVLLQVPGVYIRPEDGFGLRPNIGLRGTDPNRSAKVTLMEDNVLFGPAPYSAPAAYYFPMMGRMTGVEVFKGPASILYGPQTVAGAINYQSRPVPEAPLGQIDLSYGRFQTIRGHLHYGRKNDWGGFIVEGIYLGTEGFKTIDGGHGTDDAGFDRGEVAFQGFVNNDLSSHAFNRLTVKFVGSRERSNETYLGLTDGDFGGDPYRRYAGSQLDNMESWRTAVSLRHNLAVGDTVKLETTAYRHDFERTWERASRFLGSDADGEAFVDILSFPESARYEPFYDVVRGEENSASVNDPTDLSQNIQVTNNRRRYTVMGIQTRLRAEWETGQVHHEVESGVRFHYDTVDRYEPERTYAMQELQLVWNGEPDLLLVDNRGETQALAGYVMYGIEVKGLTITPGLRVEYIRTFFEDELNAPDAGLVAEDPQLVFLPGIGLQYTIFEGFAALFGVHRGFSAVAPGNRDTSDPESSINYEAGFRYLTKDTRGFGELIGFFNDYRNITSLCTASTGCDPSDINRQFNDGRAFIGGIEALGGYDVPLPRNLNMPTRVSYTYTNATYRSTFVSGNPVIGPVFSGDPIDFVPPHVLNAQVGIEQKHWGIYTNGTYVSPFTEGVVTNPLGGEVELPRTDGYFVLDLVTRVRFEPVEAYLRLQNITNTRAIVSRRPFGARPNAPFSIQIGVQVTF